MHAFLELFLPVPHTKLFPIHWLLSHIIIVETMDSGDRKMNSVTGTIINPLKEYWLSCGLNQPTPVVKILEWAKCQTKCC